MRGSIGGRARFIPAQGKHVEVDAPLDRLPLFVRVGAAVPVQPVIQHTGEMQRAPLSITIARGADGTSSFYEDAGEGYEYQRGAFRTTTITQTGTTLRLARTGAYSVSRPLATIEMLNVQTRPRAVSIDGRAVENFTYDETTKRLGVPLPAENVAEIVVTP